MTRLTSEHLRIDVDAAGRIVDLHRPGTAVRAPIDVAGLTHVTPGDAADEVMLSPDGRELCCSWLVACPGGELTVCTRLSLVDEEPYAACTIEVDNRSGQAIWQVTYPRLSGLTEYPDSDEADPSWLAAPFLMGEKTPSPVKFVHHHRKTIDSWGRHQFGCFDIEGQGADIAYSYPGMWTMQYLAYGHRRAGGIYFAAHDGTALYKRFGLYGEGDQSRHAVMAMKQYPEDRLAAGASFRSLYPVMIGLYEGDWWGASAIYRRWALRQQWCQRGPTRHRADIPDQVKNLDLWYWNWQFPHISHPDHITPAVAHLKNSFGCEVALHWYGCANEEFNGNWHVPDVYPYNPDVRRILKEGVKRLHDLGVPCIPYVECRLWSEQTQSFLDADGLAWVTRNEHGRSADPWPGLGHTMCPTAGPWQQLMLDVTLPMLDDIGMDGAYLDQLTGCYAVPCFDIRHDHGAGGHDHWVRGCREVSSRLREQFKQRSPANIMTSESVIECFLDLYDLNLAREISTLNSLVGCPDALPIPMFHSVYHDYHMTYGTVSTFKAVTPRRPFVMEQFRFQEALCLVGGGQLMVSGLFAGDELKERFQPQLRFMKTLTEAHIAARRWLNLGEWMPPPDVQCMTVDISSGVMIQPPIRRNVPAVLGGCFDLDGTRCVVLVNHTDRPQSIRITLKSIGMIEDVASAPTEPRRRLRQIFPEASDLLYSTSHGIVRMELPACAAHVLIVSADDSTGGIA